MLRFLLLILLIDFAFPLFAQLSLRGNLTDGVTGAPVGFATVYLDGTSIGDVSADDGSFRLNVPAGRENSVMIVSHLNYKTIAVTLSPSASKLDLSLQPKAATLTSIEVADDDLRAANLEEFRRRLIGTDGWGKKTEVLNDEVIRFARDARRVTIKVASKEMEERLRKRDYRNPEWSEDGKTFSYDRPTNLKAATVSALQLKLPHFGYELQLDLQAYESDYRTNRMSYLSTSYFIPDTTSNKRLQRRYARNRREAYYGSSLHFVRSLLRDSLRENGFQVTEVIEEPRPGKMAVTRPINLQDYIRKGEGGAYYLFGLEDRSIAVLYYGRRNVPGRSPSLQESAGILQSRMLLIATEAVLYLNGIQGDTNLLFSGDIGNRALAWALPRDYWPDK